MCSLSILNFVSSNRIDRLEVSIVFHEDSEISVKSQGVYVGKVILGTVFFVYYHRFFVLIVTSLSFDRFLWLLFIRHNSFLIIHLLLQLLFNSFYKILYIYIYIYETKLKIMQLNLYLTPISQGTYGTKELQFECKHTHMVKSSLIQIIYVAMKVLHGALFNFILFYLVMI